MCSNQATFIVLLIHFAFQVNKEFREKLVVGARKKLNRENFKVPSEKPSPAKSMLTPITSDKSSGSGKSSEKGKMMTNYSCPFAPSCDFILTKAEMREMTKASQHLIKEHKVLIFVLQ